jgi:hypothetical protein
VLKLSQREYNTNMLQVQGFFSFFLSVASQIWLAAGQWAFTGCGQTSVRARLSEDAEKPHFSAAVLPV